MSAEEFIYSVINADNVAQLDLNVIANTLASADSLIRQIKSQQVENESLKEKISSLRTSALQIKQLYEAEVGKNQGTVNREGDYIRQLKELEASASAAENARVNAELREKETVAELERKLEESRERYDGLAVDMMRNCTLLAENSLLPGDQQMKFREMKIYVQTLVQNGRQVPEDILAYLNRKKLPKKKRKADVECRDQATMTSCPTLSSVGVNTIRASPSVTTSSTSTQDMSDTQQFSITNDTFPSPKKVPEPPKKTFSDKSTMYSSSTITRSTCTSAFIKRVDVGVNYPEVVPKSIDDILRECVVELPSLLSPILDEIPVRSESIQTQTEPLPETDPIEQQRPQTVTCGTNTNLRNIRRKVDYVRKSDKLTANHLLSSIKKEEVISPASSIQNLPVVFQQTPEEHAAATAAAAGVNPQLTQIWGLLGDTMFRLLGSGRMFDSQCYNTINERLAMINNLIDPESRRTGTEMMSEVFAAAAASAAMASGREVTTKKHVLAASGGKIPVVSERVVPSRGKSMEDYEEDVVGMDECEDEQVPSDPWEGVPSESDETVTGNDAIPADEQRPVEAEENNDVPAASSEVLAEPDALSSAVNKDVLASPAVVPIEPTPTDPSNDTKETAPVLTELPEVRNNAEIRVFKLPEPSPPVVDPPFAAVAQHTEESNDYSSLMEQTDEPVAGDDGKPDFPVPLEENDEIALELRLMEEGNSFLDDSLPAPLTVHNLSDVSQKHYLEVLDEEDTASITDDESDRMTIVETSPLRLSASSSCTSIGSNGTLISPIKVKETNELVKDQFKTPTSPAISKRKLREMLDQGGPSKRGRLSPTTESLLEDDWDQRKLRQEQKWADDEEFEDISAYSPVKQLDDDEDDEDMDEFHVPDELLMQPMTLGKSQPMKIEKLHPIETDVGTESALRDSPESPVEDQSAAPVSKQWDDFKVPLQVDIGEPSVTVPTSNTDSPESPPLEDSPLLPMEDYPMSPLEDSPMSPEPETPAFSSTSSSRSSVCSFSCDESPMSPPLQTRASIYNEVDEPKIIPLENVLTGRLSNQYSNTPIAKTIAKYHNGRRAEVLLKIAPQVCKQEAALIKRVVGKIKAYVKDEWTEENLNQRCMELLKMTRDTRILSLAMINCVVSYGDMVGDTQCSPPAPVLPKTTQQLVLLVKTLNESLFSFDRVILQEIDRQLFTLKADKVMMEATTAMTYLYVGISDSNRLYGCTARLYIYKCLYYFNFKGFPLVYYVLKSFPHALPKKGSLHYDNSDAMVSTIRTVLMNINYIDRNKSPDAHLYKKGELLKLLKFFYGYQQGSPTYEELIVNLVEKIKANKLKNVDYCLILVAKRKGYDWAKDNIVQKYLYPLLNDYLKQMDSDGSLDDRICCLIFTITAIFKTQPNFQDVTGIMQILGSILQMANGNRRVQEAAVAGLMRFTRFCFADIYEWLCKWCPSYEVSGRIKLMLATFIHRKEDRFWQQLNQRMFV